MSSFEIICQSPYAVNAPRTGRGADHQTALSGRWLDAPGIRLSCVCIRGRGRGLGVPADRRGMHDPMFWHTFPRGAPGND